MRFVNFVGKGQGLGHLLQEAQPIGQPEALQAVQVGQDAFPQERLLDEVDPFLALFEVHRLEDMRVAQLQGQGPFPAQGLPGCLEVGRTPRQKFEAHVHPETTVLGQPDAAAGLIPELAQDNVASGHHVAGFKGNGKILVHEPPPLYRWVSVLK